MGTRILSFIGVVGATCAVACGQAAAEHSDEAARASSTAEPSPEAHAVDALPDGYMRVPGGVSAHVDCVHEIPNGGSHDENGNVTVGGRLVAHYGKCTHPLVFGERMHASEPKPEPDTSSTPQPVNWVEATMINSAANRQFVSLTNTFVVPEPPSNQSNQLLFYFSGIEQPSTAIVQPVLQWGVTSPAGYTGSGAGGTSDTLGSTSSWIYASWSVDGFSNTVYHSTPITVHPGDTLEASMTMLNQSNVTVGFAGQTFTNAVSNWTIDSSDLTTGQASVEISTVVTPQNSLWSFGQAGVLEAYGVGSCNEYPATGETIFQFPTTATSAFGSPGSATFSGPTSSGWFSQTYTSGLSSNYPGPACGFGATISSSSSGTTLTY